jgi:hypothetical protein
MKVRRSDPKTSRSEIIALPVDGDEAKDFVAEEGNADPLVSVP